MKTFPITLAIAVVTVLKIINVQADSEISSTFAVEYPDDYCSSAPDPDPVTVTVPIKSTALIVMQEAATLNLDLRFSAKYFGPDLGYSIRVLNGTKYDASKSCFWFFDIRDPKGNEFSSPLGVSNYIVPGDGYTLIYRFQRYVPSNSTHSNDSEPVVELPVEEETDTVMVEYSIEYMDIETCGQGLELVPPPLVETEIAQLGSAQRVMEESTDFGRNYRFTVSFFNNELGYFVDAINGTSSNVIAGCFWFFYVRLPNGTEIQPNVGITNYLIPSDGHSVIMRFESTQHVPETTVADTMFMTEAQSRTQMFLSTVLIMTLLAILLF